MEVRHARYVPGCETLQSARPQRPVEMEAVAHALRWVASRGGSQTTHVIILTISLLQWEAQTGICQCLTSTFENSYGCTALDIPE